MRSPNKILQQIINHVYRSKELKIQKENVYDKVKLSSAFPNNFYMLEDGYPFIVTSITKGKNGETYCQGWTTNNLKALYDYPCDSFKYLGSCVVNENDFFTTEIIKSKRISGKFVCTPIYGSSFVLTPLLHTFAS